MRDDDDEQVIMTNCKTCGRQLIIFLRDVDICDDCLKGDDDND